MHFFLATVDARVKHWDFMLETPGLPAVQGLCPALLRRI